MKRSTWVLLAIVLAALAVIFLWERKRPGTDEAKQKREQLFQGMPESKEFTRAERSGEEPMTLEKAGEAWTLRAPVQDAADGYGIEGFLDRIRQAHAIRFLDAPVPWKDLGLEKPRATWTLKAGGKTWTLALGAKAELGEGIYLKAGDRAVLAPADLETLLLKNPLEFRGRDLLSPGSGRVVSLRVSRPGAPTLAATRSGEEWSLKEPFADAADSAKMEPLLDSVTFAQASSFEESGEGKDFGLSAPRAEITLTTDKGKSVVIKVGADAPAGAASEGSPAAEERVYAAVTGRPSVMVVPGKILKDLAVPADSLRSPDLFRHQAFDAQELKVEGGANLTLKRNDKGDWSFASGGKGAKPADATTLAEALLDLRGVYATALGPGAPAPEGYVTLTLKGKGFEEGVKVGPERDGKRYAYPKSRTVALLLDGEQWKRVEAAIKVVPQAAPPKP
jgi:hypothetical protein